MTDFQSPTGPMHTFRAIPFPLHPEKQMELRILSEAIRACRHEHQKSISMHDQAAFDRTRKDVMEADAALNDYTEKLREATGVPVTRREFRPVTGSLGSSVEMIRRQSLPILGTGYPE